MQMNSEIKLIKDKLKNIIGRREILDVILFGSVIKGKALPRDVDIAVITEEDYEPGIFNIEGFHFSFLKPIDFFKKRITLLSTIFREGYSLKFDKSFSELYGFRNRVLFRYELSRLTNSKKVKVVNILRGKKGDKGLVVENGGEWLSNQVFFIPMYKEHIFDKFFINFAVKFKKYYVLMH